MDRLRRLTDESILVPASPNSCITCAFSAQEPDDFRRLPLSGCVTRAKPGFVPRHSVIRVCVFMHIVGSTFFFNIFPVGEARFGHSREPVQWGTSEIDNRQSPIIPTLQSSKGSKQCIVVGRRSGISSHPTAYCVPHTVCHVQSTPRQPLATVRLS
jgi:hypothetical protein